MNEISFQPFVIGVAGGSGSGKSTVSQQVLASFGAETVSVVMQDDYYRDQSDLTPEVRRKQNYDTPQAFDCRCWCSTSRPCATAKRSRCRSTTSRSTTARIKPSSSSRPR